MSKPDGEPDNSLVDAEEESKNRPQTRLVGEEPDAIRTGDRGTTGVNSLAR